MIFSIAMQFENATISLNQFWHKLVARLLSMHVSIKFPLVNNLYYGIEVCCYYTAVAKMG